jgi:tRNA dimethylallyltransferase
MISKKSSDENKPIKAIIICGPTGSGKSAVAMQLATRFGGQIIGADSRQIYRRLDIGTAKPTIEERSQIPHFMIDIADVSDDFTAKDYARMASESIEKVALSGAIPLIVGGSGLYLSALTRGLFEGPSKDPDLRARLELLIKEKGSDFLHRELFSIDPQSAVEISPGDTIRIIRALEIYYLTGRKLSELKTSAPHFHIQADFLWLGLTYDRRKLYKRIDDRVCKMLQDGLLDEIDSLVKDGFAIPILRKKIVGYYEVIDALQKNVSISTATGLIQQHSRNYAKRQLTWFRNKAPVRWLSTDHNGFYNDIVEAIKQHLGKKT